MREFGGLQMITFCSKKLPCPNDQIELNNNLNNVAKWCRNWGMVVNTDKTVFLPVTHKKTPVSFTYELGSSSLKKIDNYKYLYLTLPTYPGICMLIIFAHLPFEA